MKIHGHPQKTDYKDDGSDWPLLESQGWWPASDPIKAGHLHVAVKFPKSGEITSSTGLVVPFTLKLHDFDGVIGQFFGRHVESVIWDDTGTSTPPLMQGMAEGLAQWSGKATLNFFLGQQPWLGSIGMLPLHGYTSSFFNARAVGANKDLLEVEHVVDFFSALDTSVHEQVPSQQGVPGHVLSSRVTITNQTITDGSAQTLGGTSFGVMVTEVNGPLPFPDLPIDTPWSVPVNFYNYTSPFPDQLQNGLFQQILDANLHGTPPNIPPNEGTILSEVSAGVLGVPNMPVIFDPATMGAGPHKQLLRWRQERNGESISSVLSLPITVGPSIPPPPKPDTTGVPNVVGQSQANALQDLTAARLIGSVTKASEPLVPLDIVISQSPSAGTVVDVNSTVALVVSSGPTPPPADVWVNIPAIVKQHSINGVPQPEWQICDPQGANCFAVVKKP
jgi:hypothetical protein